MKNIKDHKLEYSTRSIKSYLSIPDLIIPEYQRPYKWSSQQLVQLLLDLQEFKEKKHYRLGTIVIHKEEVGSGGKRNIVDGQQRTITLVLLLLALKDKFSDDDKLTSNAYLRELYSFMLPEFKFNNAISKFNIINNYIEIKRLISDFDINIIEFILNKCEVVIFELLELTEAFQLFDSQNSRGKSLEPHDLLKAFHLREFTSDEMINQKELVETWENEETDNLSGLFSNFLFRIRGWSNGFSSRNFTKGEINQFKGINLNTRNQYPYLKGLIIINCLVAGYNDSKHRMIDNCNLQYPFQIDQIIINGRLFFEMINYYLPKYKDMHKGGKGLPGLNDRSKDIFSIIDSYKNRGRTGDRYTRMLFDTALMYYMDKFGDFYLNEAIFKIFVWSYSLRLSHFRLLLASVDNYVLETPGGNLFSLIKLAQAPSQILNKPLAAIINENQIKAKGVEEIQKFFKNNNIIANVNK